MSISLCLATYNRLPHLKRSLTSIFNGFEDYPYEVIIADGGSTDGTIEYLRGLDNVKLIEQGKLTGAVKAFNACFKIAKGDYIIATSDDIIIIPEVLIKACKLMDKHPEIGLVSPKILDAVYSNFPSVSRRPYLILCKIHIFRASVLRDINFFDERFRTYFADGDATLSVLNLGHTIIFTREVGLIHMRVHDENLKRNRKIMMVEGKHYKQKWEKFNLKLEEYLRFSPFKEYRSLLFHFIINRMFNSPLVQTLMQRKEPFVVNLYDWLLQQNVVFKAKEYNYLKDFYLAQRLPKEVLKQ